MPHDDATTGRTAELDIRTSADEVVQLLQQHRPREAAERLDVLRHDQQAPVQDALDRYVAAGARDQLDALRAPGAVVRADAATLQPTLQRLDAATRPPSAPQVDALSEAQRYDVYASIVAVRGNDAARTALGTQDRVVLGLREQTRTTEGATRDAPGVATDTHRGTGVYDDRMVVLWKDADGTRHTYSPSYANTDPTAQYDAHAAGRTRNDPYGDVTFRHADGADADGDRVADLGRLAEGTTEMRRDTHRYNSANPQDFALRPTDEAIRNGAGRVERDTNGDGWFDSRDPNGVQALNSTFLIHRGSLGNTDSAGCQTIRSDDYQDFQNAVTGHAGQTRWQYVLTSTAPANAREVQPQVPTAAQPTPAIHDPRDPQHPDHALQQQIHDQVAALGGRYAETADAYSLSLLYRAKEQNMTHVDMVAVSNPTGGRAAGEFLFLVQGQARDPASLRTTVLASEVQGMPIEQSLQRLDLQAAQAQTPQQAQQPPVQDNPTHNAPAMRGP